MYISIVQVYVKPETIDAFLEITLKNAQGSLQEAGIIQFDVLQDRENPSHFTLYEVFRTAEDVPKHHATEHYLRWRETVADMMTEPRTSVKYKNIFPTDEAWS